MKTHSLELAQEWLKGQVRAVPHGVHYHIRMWEKPNLPEDPIHGPVEWAIERHWCPCGWGDDHVVDPIPVQKDLE